MELQTPILQFKDEALAKANMRHLSTLDFGKVGINCPFSVQDCMWVLYELSRIQRIM